MKEFVTIFDTTLRDGEQAPGASLGIREKLEVAEQLERLGVDVIEGGFPYASPGDFESVRLISMRVHKPAIAALARCDKKDIDAARKALKPARRARIHVFLATSPIHMKYKLKKTEDEVLDQACRMVRYARRFTDDVEFSPEDASRSRLEFLLRVIEGVIRSGARTVNIPDTVGYAIPGEFGRLIAEIKENVPNIHKAVVSVHCHDDLGMAVGNSLAAVKSGARQVECTINGIGERAGNCSLEEVVMAIATRRDFFGLATRVRTQEIYKTSRLVSSLTGFVVPPNKAIVGANAFRHESGIHQHGILAKKLTYEIVSPKDVGFGKSLLVLGKHSGRHAFLDRLKRLGLDVKPDQLQRAFAAFKKLADKKKEIFDEDLVALVEGEMAEIPETYKLDYFHITSGTGVVPTAIIRLRKKERLVEAAASGDGPVDACYKAIDKITRVKLKLEDYAIHAVTGEKEAQGEVTIKARAGGQEVTGRGASTDIVEGSVKAYLHAVNKIIAHVGRPRRVKVMS